MGLGLAHVTDRTHGCIGDRLFGGFREMMVFTIGLFGKFFSKSGRDVNLFSVSMTSNLIPELPEFG